MNKAIFRKVVPASILLKTAIDECLEKEGVGEIYIIGKKGG